MSIAGSESIGFGSSEIKELVGLDRRIEEWFRKDPQEALNVLLGMLAESGSEANDIAKTFVRFIDAGTRQRLKVSIAQASTRVSQFLPDNKKAADVLLTAIQLFGDR